MNKAIISGRICTDIELKATSNDVSVCSFKVAVNRRFKNADGNYDADFIPCVAWRGQAEFISKYFSKGKPIEIVGAIQTRNYEKEDGQKVYITEVVVEEPRFVLSDKTEVSNEVPSPLPSEATQISSFEGFMPTSADDSDLPF